MGKSDDKLIRKWYKRKSALMEEILGKEHDAVMHAVFPWFLGGGLDLYYYPQSSSGTAIATKELSNLPGDGSSNEAFQCYELVMFTRQSLNLEKATNKRTKFGRVHGRIQAILNCIGPYSKQETLNPHETCEFPKDMYRVGGGCLIFDAYPKYPDGKPVEFGMMCIIEIFKSEMTYARRYGAARLFKRLRAEGYYPYSDMDRNPVA